MKKFNNFDEAKKAAESNGSTQIPVGAYVCKIINIRYEESEAENISDRIQIQFDVAEGEHKGFFKSQYESNTDEDKRWKGKVTLYVPTDDGSERDTWTKNNFARYISALEKSNKGYTWDWDENKWKDKYIGFVFGPTGTVIEGKEIVYNEVHTPCSVTEVRENKFWKKALELRKKNGYTGNGNTSNSEDFMSIPNNATTEEIPF